MVDFATSSSPAVQRQLDRLTLLSPGADILGLGRITQLLDRVGNPHRKLPPVFHVAGTNGKGSTCAFLRAAIEASGLTAHVYSSPHLVRFNERIRIAGRLIEDDALAPLLEEVLDAGGDIGASFFEATTAAAFLAFSRTPADACVIEVGLGGRLDATNVIQNPAACGIAQLGIDHQSFLGDTLIEIAGEKAGIAKPGRPLVISHYPDEITAVVTDTATRAGAIVSSAWGYRVTIDRTGTLGLLVHAADREVFTPFPRLAGTHQFDNLALAIAMIAHQDRIRISDEALATAAAAASWPARMQRLRPGPLKDILPEDTELWLDGGHNANAGQAVADALEDAVQTPHGPRASHLILGMLANKDPEGLLAPLAPLLASVTAVPVPGHEHHAPEDLARIAQGLGIRSTMTAQDIPEALGWVRRRIDPRGEAPSVLILGSLYLAGTVLEANGELPD